MYEESLVGPGRGRSIVVIVCIPREFEPGWSWSRLIQVPHESQMTLCMWHTLMETHTERISQQNMANHGKPTCPTQVPLKNLAISLHSGQTYPWNKGLWRENARAARGARNAGFAICLFIIVHDRHWHGGHGCRRRRVCHLDGVVGSKEHGDCLLKASESALQAVLTLPGKWHGTSTKIIKMHQGQKSIHVNQSGFHKLTHDH